MSYKTRPTGDFLKTGKVGKSGVEFVGGFFFLLPKFSCQTLKKKTNDNPCKTLYPGTYLNTK